MAFTNSASKWTGDTYGTGGSAKAKNPHYRGPKDQSRYIPPPSTKQERPLVSGIIGVPNTGRTF